MARFLANENVPDDAVASARHAGHDVARVREFEPGACDERVLELARGEGRVVITFDKDFGWLCFGKGKHEVTGVILLRFRLRSPAFLARSLVAVLEQGLDWESHFCVAEEGRLRMIPLPD